MSNIIMVQRYAENKKIKNVINNPISMCEFNF